MNSKEELQKHIKIVWDIFLYAKESYHYAFYLSKPDGQSEIEFLSKSSDARFISHIMWRTSVIELSKLFSGGNNDKFNLTKIINKLKRDGVWKDAGITKEKLDYWENEIEKNKEVIESVKTLRNKVYSHTDLIKPDSSEVKLEFCDLKTLLDITENIIRQIYSLAFNTYADMDVSVFNKGRISSAIKTLSNKRRETFFKLSNS